MSALRPFPDRPNLEFDRKAAKLLLRQLLAGEREALDRARARGVDTSRPTEDFTLADAQLIVAREYGFASWPRLVQYHGDIVRQSRALDRPMSREQWERTAKSLLSRHKARQKMAGRTLAAFVPRLYGMTPQEVLDVAVSEADAQLAIAREAGQPSWNALLTAEAPKREPNNYWEITPHQLAVQAIKANDVEKLKAVIREHPVVLNPPPYEREPGGTLANSALGAIEPREGLLTPLSREMREYLESIGVDLQTELNMRLCNPFTARSIENVRAFLDAGADPDWVAPNGFSMLEHALLGVWRGDVIDLLASRAKPRKALWICAGLGDVQGVASFLDQYGKPTAAARDLRSPFDCSRMTYITPLYYPDDDELLIEALSIAAFNGRANVIDYLASRGVNLDNMAWGVPIVNLAVGNGWLESVEALVRNGANLDIPSSNDSNGSARDMARWMWNNSNDSPKFRRIAELCGLGIDKLRSEREATIPKDPPFQQKLQEALAYAQQAAIQQKRPEVHAENLLMGMLRLGGLPLLYYANSSKLDRERFKADIMPVAQAIQEPAAGIAVPFGAQVRAFLDDARAMAKERYSEQIGILNVLYAMTRHETGYAVDLLQQYGGSVQELNRKLRRSVLNEFE